MIAMAGDKLLDIAEFMLGIAGPETVVAGRVFGVLHARNRCRKFAAEFDRNLKIGVTVEHQRRYPKRRQNCRDIDLAVELQDRSQTARTARQPFEFSEL